MAPRSSRPRGWCRSSANSGRRDMSGILILAEHRDGELRPVTHELIAAAQTVRAGIGDRVTVAVVGAGAERLAAGLSGCGVDQILTIASGTREFDADTAEAALAAAATDCEPA